jgi:hypothetical protein
MIICTDPTSPRQADAASELLVSQRSGCRTARAPRHPPCKLLITDQEGWTSARVGSLAEHPSGRSSRISVTSGRETQRRATFKIVRLTRSHC